MPTGQVLSPTGQFLISPSQVPLVAPPCSYGRNEFFLPLAQNSQPEHEWAFPWNSQGAGNKPLPPPLLNLLQAQETRVMSGISVVHIISLFCSFTYTSICPGMKHISDMTSVCIFFLPPPVDLTAHFSLGRASVSFKSFSQGFVKNLSGWRVCHFSQSSSKSWQFSHNGICWQVVRADSEYVWKTVKLVEKKYIKARASFHWKLHVKLWVHPQEQRPPLLGMLHASPWQPKKAEAWNMNGILSLQRSGNTLPLNSIYLHKIECAWNVPGLGSRGPSGKRQ